MCVKKSVKENPKLWYLLIECRTRRGHLKYSAIFNNDSEALKCVASYLQDLRRECVSSLGGEVKSLVVSISCGTPTNVEDHG
jgi:hypothetical protein